MKIGIVVFNRTWRLVNGVTTSADVYRDVLTQHGFSAEIIAINLSGCPFDFPGQDVEYEFNKLVWREKLLEYDRLIFLHYASLGRVAHNKWNIDVVLDFLHDYPKEHCVFVIHDEFEIAGPVVSRIIHEWGVRDRWLFNSEMVQEHIGGFLGITGTWYNHITPKKLVFNQNDKIKDIHYIGRLIEAQKFSLTLLYVCQELKRDVDIYGPRPLLLEQEIKKHSANIKRLWEKSYKGHCNEMPPAIVSRLPYRFSWNLVTGFYGQLRLLSGFTGDFLPRLEQSAMEAMRAWSMPILIESTIPEWLPKEYVITVDSYNKRTLYTQLSERLIYDGRTVEKLHACNDLLDKRIQLSLRNLRNSLNF